MVASKDIDRWAQSRRAQDELPILISRLIGASGTATALSVPGGDAVSTPGFDGEIESTGTNPWVPTGRSVWEMSVDGSPTSKANRDYTKRVAELGAKERAERTYVVAMGRRWSGKRKWIEAKRKTGEWAEVRAYDADDLEAWLEVNLPVQLWFAEQLGLTNSDVRSCEAAWDEWVRDAEPAITRDAVLSMRDRVAERFVKLLEERAAGGTISLHADSVEEAVAFACACLIERDPAAEKTSLVVRTVQGWQAVRANEGVKVAVAASSEVAKQLPGRNGLLIVVPYATGDRRVQFSGSAERHFDPDISLRRPPASDFSDILETMGLDRGDARRLAVQSGRSWSVFRRLRSGNPHVREPIWLRTEHMPTLTTLALVGSWLLASDADRQFVSAVAGIPHEELERDRRVLAAMDDAPVVIIGDVVKAKSTLELWKLVEDKVSGDQFDRFCTETECVLTARDPQLDLPNDQRWMAAIHDKLRPDSGVLLGGVSDALPRIATWAADDRKRAKIERLVHMLLHRADEDRWMSLSGFLQDLAEAAPSEFLSALKASTRAPDTPVFALFRETSSGGAFGGQCWYSSLLWALERLAWSPPRLLAVSRILADFSTAPRGGNWANSPEATLKSFYRSWLPKTAATVEQRKAALDSLIKSHPDQAFALLDVIAHVGYDVADENVRPSWRDDDAGAGEGVTHAEMRDVLVHAADRMFEMADGSVDRTIKLFEKYGDFDPDRRERVVEAIERVLPKATDEELCPLRKAMQHKLHRDRNYRDGKKADIEAELEPIERLYRRSEPTDLIERHRWLFENGYVELPECDSRRSYKGQRERVDRLRRDAVREIFDTRSLEGLLELHRSAGDPYTVGHAIPSLRLTRAETVESILGLVERGRLDDLAGTWLCSLSDAKRHPTLEALVGEAQRQGWPHDRIGHLVGLARAERPTWELAERLGPETAVAYWTNLHAYPAWADSIEEREHAIRRLLDHKCFAAALRSIQHREEDLSAEMIADILEANLTTEENGFQGIDYWMIREWLEQLEKPNALPKDRLLRLEFRLIPLLGYHEAYHAKALMHEIVTDPAMFLDLVAAAYKTDDGEGNGDTEAERRLAEVAHHILYECRTLPGMRSDGAFDPDVFREFTTKLFELANEKCLTKGASISLGQILAHSPEHDDGSWPLPAVCDLLDRDELDVLREHLGIGVYNKRGVTSRAMHEGGAQERVLEHQYRGYATRLQNSHPNLAETIERIADGYRRDAEREDIQAEQRCESL